MNVVDPLRKESSVRLRAYLEGRAPTKSIRLERSEEGSQWESLDAVQFAAAVREEVIRIQRWLEGPPLDDEAYES